MFPFIFLISLAFLVIASLTSKLQNDSTNLLISIYSALGPAESAAIVLTTTVFILHDRPETIIKILLIAALAIIFLVNLMGYIIQTPYLLSDRKFLKWANRRMRKNQSRGNLIWFHIISLLSLFTSYKLKMVLFSRLFNFECFKFQLENVSKFKVFNVLSFIGYFPEILSLYCCISALAYSSLTLEELLIFIDLLVIVALNMIFSLIIIKKDESFFHENNGGIPMNKVFNLVEQMSSSTQIIGRRDRQSRQKRRTELDDIPQYDQFAYTSTKRDRSPKQKTYQKQKTKEEDSYYFEENDSEVTGSKIHSEISNQEMPQEVGNAVAPDLQQPSSRKNNENVLNIDDYYEDESADGVETPQENIINKPIYKQQPLSLEQDEEKLPEDVIQAQHYASNLIRTRQDTTTTDVQYPKNTHTKVSEYLMSFQQNQYPLLNHQFESKPMDLIENEYVSEEGSENNEGKFVELINESALIDSQPSFYPNILTPHVQEHQKQVTIRKEQEQAAKKIVQRVVSAHHSPKKAITTQEQPKELRKNYLSHSISLNQNHDEQPIKNKSIEKAKKQQSHPINPPVISHPIYGQKGSKSEEEDQSDLAISIGKRGNIAFKQPAIKTFQDNQTPPQQLPALQGQESKPDVPRPKFYHQFVHQPEQVNPSFQRSHPHSLALFSKNKTKNNSTTIDQSVGDSIPRQPVQALFPTTPQKEDPRNQSSFVLRRNFDRAIKFSSKPRQRPMTSKSGRFGKYSLDKKTARGLQGKKMLSLEKIYLQRLTNF